MFPLRTKPRPGHKHINSASSDESNQNLNTYVDALNRRLRRHGLPSAYRKRLVLELTDHAEHLRRDQDLKDAVIIQRLGEVEQIAEAVRHDKRLNTWANRWPLLTFFIAPIPTLIASLLAVVWIVITAAQPLFQTIPITSMHDWIQTGILYCGHGLSYGAVALAACIFVFASRRAQTRLWLPLISSLLIAAFFAIVHIDIQLPLAGPGTGHYSVGIQLPPSKPNPHGGVALLPITLLLGFHTFQKFKPSDQQTF